MISTVAFCNGAPFWLSVTVPSKAPVTVSWPSAGLEIPPTMNISKPTKTNLRQNNVAGACQGMVFQQRASQADFLREIALDNCSSPYLILASDSFKTPYCSSRTSPGDNDRAELDQPLIMLRRNHERPSQCHARMGITPVRAASKRDTFPTYCGHSAFERGAFGPKRN